MFEPFIAKINLKGTSNFLAEKLFTKLFQEQNGLCATKSEVIDLAKIFNQFQIQILNDFH